MATNTPDFNLTKPAVGETGWGNDVNANFDTIDEELNRWETTSQSTNYTAANYETVLADASGGAVSVTLPAVDTDIVVNVKKTDATANAVTIATPNTETIDGQSTIDITAQYSSRTIVSDGSNYFII